MKIKKRLTISNILMIVIPVVIIFIIAQIMSIPFSMAYEKKFASDRERDSNAYFIQQSLRPDSKKLNNKDDFEKLSEELRNFLEPKGYHLIITYDKKIISSNITDKDKEAISKIGEDMLFQTHSLVIEMNSISMVTNSFIKDEKVVNIIAINSAYEPIRVDMKREMSAFVISYILIVYCSSYLDVLS